jgi:hypothetical protein
MLLTAFGPHSAQYQDCLLIYQDVLARLAEKSLFVAFKETAADSVVVVEESSSVVSLRKRDFIANEFGSNVTLEFCMSSSRCTELTGNCRNRGKCENDAGKKCFRCRCNSGFTGAFQLL